MTPGGERRLAIQVSMSDSGQATALCPMVTQRGKVPLRMPA